MTTPAITVVMRDYDYLSPLYGGDVIPDGVRLTLDRKTRITQSAGDPSILASELSFSRFLIGLAQGDRSFVGIPFFPTRAFRHRCFFVRRDSALRDLRSLEGTRIGTNSWPDTGNTWTRAALRDQGVAIDRIRWTVGPIDDTYPPGRPQADLPAYVTQAPTGRTLREMLLAGDLDALMVPFPPKGFYDSDSPIVRLLRDYRAAELDYYRRTRIYPIHHIVGLRRQVFEHEPQIAVAIYKTLEASRLYWQRQRLFMAELTPWVLTDMEETAALMGTDWQPGGVRANAHITRALCGEELAQRLIDQPLDPGTVFAEFDTVLAT
jgi:4,5-dihydroxyphthalate decarboxylase